MSTIKFALVIGLPDYETFGYLIITSYATVIFGAACFVIYVVKRHKNTKPWTDYKPA